MRWTMRRAERRGDRARSVRNRDGQRDGGGAEHRQVEMPLADARGADDPDVAGALGLRLGERVDPAGQRPGRQLGDAGGERGALGGACGVVAGAS